MNIYQVRGLNSDSTIAVEGFFTGVERLIRETDSLHFEYPSLDLFVQTIGVGWNRANPNFVQYRDWRKKNVKVIP